MAAHVHMMLNTMEMETVPINQYYPWTKAIFPRLEGMAVFNSEPALVCLIQTNQK